MTEAKPTDYDYSKNRKLFSDLIHKDSHELLAIIASKLMDGNYDIYTDRLTCDIAATIIGSLARAEPDEYLVTVSARADGVKTYRVIVNRGIFNDMGDLRRSAIDSAHDLAESIASEISEDRLEGISVTVTKCMHSLVGG